MTYQEFLESKAITHIQTGIENPPPLNPKLFPFQRDVVSWALRRGRAALFEDCGLGKTFQQLEWARRVNEHTGEPVLILAPLMVANQTRLEGESFGIESRVVESQADVFNGVNITNYEKLHRFEANKFAGVALDESSILKNYAGATRNEIIDAFKALPFKLACTATPAPNDFMEIGNHAEFLGVMTRSEMLSTFFVHDGGDTSKWRLKGHAEADFWRWLCSFSVSIRKPSDLGYEDGDFVLPPLNIAEHVVEVNSRSEGYLIPLPASSLQERRSARRASIEDRIAKAAEIANSNDEQWLVWCDLNDESKALAQAIGGAVEVTGSDSDEEKTEAMRRFSDGSARALVSKGSICGWGMNWQHCHNVLYVGLSDSWETFYQTVRRCWRFGQKKPVNVHIVTSNLEDAVVSNIKRKQADAERMAEQMVKHMADISSVEIRGTKRTETTYNPLVEMMIPDWLKAA